MTTLVIALQMAATGPAIADPVQWTEGTGGNGHWYEFIDHGADITWEAAKAACEAQGGYLVTITSQAEQNFVANSVLLHTAEAALNWIGGWQNHDNPAYSEPGGGWEWVTGEEWDYTNWHLYDPNDVCGEDVLAMWSWDGTYSYHGGWVDLSWDRFGVQGYICEADEPVACDWTFRTDEGPPDRHHAAMTFDSGAGVAVLFGVTWRAAVLTLTTLGLGMEPHGKM